MTAAPRFRRLGWWVIAIFVLVGGAIAVAPSVLAPVLARRLSAATGADVRVGWISCNPLVGRVVLHRVALAAAAAEPAVVTVGSVAIDLAIRRWLGGERALDALILRHPWVSLQRTARGDFNLASLFPMLTGPTDDDDAAHEADTGGPPAPFRIGELRIVSGSVEFQDQTTVPVLETSLHLDDATAHDLVLATGGPAAFAFHIESPLTLDLTYETAPRSSHLKATLVATDASLARALLYIPLGWQRTAGTLDATITYERKLEKDVLRAHGLRAAIALHDLALTEPWAKEPMLRAARVRLPALAVDFLKQRTDLGAIQVDDFQALVTRDDTGLHVPLATGAPGTEDSRWQTTLDRVQLGKGTAVLRHVLPGVGSDLVVPLTSGTIRMPTNEVTFSFAGGLAGGRISLDGRTLGAATTLSFGLDDLALTDASPLLGFPLPFASGRLNGTLDLRLGETTPTLTGTLGSTDGHTAPRADHPEEVLAWQQLDLTLAESTLDPLHLHLTQAEATWPYVMLHRRPDGWFPLSLTGGAVVPATPASARVTEATPAWLRIDRLTIRGGRLEFYDTTLPKAYGIDLTDVVASADAVSLAPLRAGHVTVAGALDELSPVNVSGTVAPAAADLTLAVERLLLPPLNPYLAPLLGYEITAGLARIASTLRLDGTTLETDNDIVLSRFAMRAAGQDPIAAKIGAPLSVALALMKDTRGDIHLHLPVQGDLTANQYRVDHVVREALGNALLGTLRAPLGFLRGVFSRDEGEHFDLRPVPFPAGSAGLGPEGETRVAEIARLLGRHAALRAVLIPEPSRADLERLRSADDPRPLAALAELSRARAAAIVERLTHTLGVDSARVMVQAWEPTEPDLETEPGVDIQLRAD